MDLDAEPLTDWKIPGTYVFDSSRSRLGYRLNKLAYSLTDPKNRALYLQDEDAYMEKFGLSEGQKDAIRRRDWLALMKDHGGNIYYMYKLGATVGHELYKMGAQMRGETFEQFLNSRDAKGAH